MEWNDTQFHVTSIFCRKTVVLCIQMGKLLLNALHHCFGNGLFTFLPVILHAIFPDFTASWMTMTTSYFSEYPGSPGQCLAMEKRHRCDVQLQWSLGPKDPKTPTFLLHSTIPLASSKASGQNKQTKNVYVLINNIHNRVLILLYF